MQRGIRSFLPWLVLTLSLIMAGCESSTLPSRTNSQPVVEQETANRNNASQSEVTPDPPVGSPEAVSIAASTQEEVEIYTMDSECRTLIPKLVSVANKDSIEAVVGKVLEDHNNADFSVAGYRVTMDTDTQVATIDLRLATDADRTFESLSSCEQRALFGGMRETVLNNSQWQIKEVRFTNQGKEIVL